MLKIGDVFMELEEVYERLVKSRSLESGSALLDECSVFPDESSIGKGFEGLEPNNVPLDEYVIDLKSSNPMILRSSNLAFPFLFTPETKESTQNVLL